MRLRRIVPLFPGLFCLFVTGCGAMMGSLRKDLDDGITNDRGGPTYGGPMAEGGFLSESMGESGYGSGNLGGDRYNAVGHSERGPASALNSPGPDSWVGQEKNENARRDAMHGNMAGSEEESAKNGNVPPPVKRLYKNGMRATRADFIDESPNEGSLWASDGQTNYYFTKNKVRGVGDIVSLNLDDAIIKDMTLEIRRRLTPGEMGREISNAQYRIRKKVLAGDSTDPVDLGADKSTPADPNAQAQKKDVASVRAEDREIPMATEADIDLSKSVELKTGDTMLGEIMERYPNGNYKIRAIKRIPYKNGAPRLMSVVGVVRGADISEDDQVSAGKLYEYRLEAQR